MSNRKWIFSFIFFILITCGMVMLFNGLVDPFGLFGDKLLNWYEYDITNNPRVAKIGYLDQHYEAYDSYIIGCSKTSSFAPSSLNKYYEGANFYNLMMYGGDMYDIKKTALYVIEQYSPKNIVINIGLEEPARYNEEADAMKGNLHAKVEGTSLLKFYGKYLVTNPQYAFDKIKAYYENGYLPNLNKVFNVQNGAYDKRVRDVESIVDLGEYLDNNPGFITGLSNRQYHYTAEVVEDIKEIKVACELKDIHFELIASPIYYDEVDKCSQEAMIDYFKKIAKVTDFWSFSGYSQVSYDSRYFYDALHFRNAVGDMALGAMFEDDTIYYPDGFAKYVTKENAAEVVPQIFTKKEGEYLKESYTKKVPILMYHHFDEDESKSNGTTITPDKFRNDLMALKEEGYTTIFFDELINYVYEGVELPNKPIVITIDDGYTSNYTYAYPILKALDMKATIGIIGMSVGKDRYKDSTRAMTPHFNIEQAKEMLKSGVIDIQAHSYSMHDYKPYEIEDYREGVLQKDDESEGAYIQVFKNDFNQIQAIIEQDMENHLNTYIYPLGKSSTLSEVLLTEMGIQVTVTTNEGVNTVVKGLNQSLIGLKRYNVPNTLSSEKLIELLKEQGE